MPLPTDTLKKTVNDTYGATVGAILERGTPIVYAIPRHQRAYAWQSKKHIEKYLEDLDFACDEGFPHNFGSLDFKEAGFILNTDTGKDALIHHGGKEEARYPLNEVNDGQQRLTTIFLTLAAITSIREAEGDNTYRESLNKRPSQHAYQLCDKSSKARGFRILLQENELTDHLASLILKGDKFAYDSIPKKRKLTTPEASDDNAKYPPDSRRPMRLMTDAYRKIRKHLGELTDLDKWEKSFYSAEIVLVYSKTPSHVVFEVRNARGLKVSELDKVKNKSMYFQKKIVEAGKKFGHDIVASWWSATKDMESGNVYAEDELLGYVLTIVKGRTIGKGNYEVFLKNFDVDQLAASGKAGDESRVAFGNFIDAIKWVAEAMKEVYEPHPKNSPMVFGKLDKMVARGMNKKQRAQAIVELVNITNRMDRQEVCKPIILLAYHYVQPKEFVDLLVLLEKIIFRNFAVDWTRKDKGSTEFGAYCEEFYNNVKEKDPADSTDQTDISSHFATLYGELCKWSATSLKYGLSNEKFYKKIRDENKAYGKNWTRYFLYHWEMYGPGSYKPLLRMAKNCKDWGDPSTTSEFFTIEHVMPDDGWEKYPKANVSTMSERWYWEDQYPDLPNYKENVNWLGNLVLSKFACNRAYTNFPYLRHKDDLEKIGQKRLMYLTLPGISDWEKVRLLAMEYNDWNINTITNRQERMARWARHHWRLPCETIHPLDPMEIIDEHSESFAKMHYEKIAKKDLENLKKERSIKAFEEKTEDEDTDKRREIKKDEEAVVGLDDHFDWDYEPSEDDSKYIEEYQGKSSSDQS